MSIVRNTFESVLADTVFLAARLPVLFDAVADLADDDLLAVQRRLGDASRYLDAASSRLAGEIAHRSRRELGYSGLAQREGYRTPEKLIQHATGSSARDAAALVSVGAMVRSTSAAAAADLEPCAPWLRSVGVAVSGGALTVAAAESIRRGLCEPSDAVDASQLAAAVDELVLEAMVLDADRLYRRARELRDSLDYEGAVDRERLVHEQRGLRRVARPDGCSRIIIDTDIESGAYLDDLIDKLTAPRRGGPRFIDESDQVWADAILADPRTQAQYLHDAFLGALRIGVTADNTQSRAIVGSRQPSVRVLVTADALATGRGLARVEATSTVDSDAFASAPASISIATAQRLACADGTVAIGFDAHGQALNLGRERRLFTARQRIALAARDGGCRWTGCDRPPSWTEAHHIDHWNRDDGRTDVADGILLCRHHHMLAHNNHWEINRVGAQYWLVPPADIDATQTPRLLTSKSAALGDLLSRAGSEPRARVTASRTVLA